MTAGTRLMSSVYGCLMWIEATVGVRWWCLRNIRRYLWQVWNGCGRVVGIDTMFSVNISLCYVCEASYKVKLQVFVSYNIHIYRSNMRDESSLCDFTLLSRTCAGRECNNKTRARIIILWHVLKFNSNFM